MGKGLNIRNFFSKKTKDYTYAILFFFTFSFFVYFVIRPNLISVFSSNTQVEELQKTDRLYEIQIDKIVDIQTALETNRENLGLLQESIPLRPELNKILDDIDKTVKEHNIVVERMNVENLNLKDSAKEQRLKLVNITGSFFGSFEDIYGFIKGLHSQRRLKMIKQLQLDVEKGNATSSSLLKMSLKIQGYYL